MGIYHIFFIRSSVYRHLCCFCVLAITNNAVTNMRVWISFQIMSFTSLGKYPEEGLLDHMVALFLIFWGTSIFFSKVAVPIYIPTNNSGDYLFSTPLPSFVIFCLLNNSQSKRHEVISHCGFDLHCSWWSATLSIHLYIYCLSVCLVCRNVCSVLLPIHFQIRLFAFAIDV